MRFEIVLITVNTRVSKVVADHDSHDNTIKIKIFLIQVILRLQKLFSKNKVLQKLKLPNNVNNEK